jgi:hypothetical protein
MSEVAARRGRRRAWPERVEQATLALDAAANKRAIAAFRALDVADRSRLAFELARTRRRELCLAYASVVAVTAGRKQKGGSRGKTRFTAQPCVMFIVRRKWPHRRDRKGARSTQEIPKYLLAYWSVGGERRMCAVPTDVVVARAFRGARAQRGVQVHDAGLGLSATGNFACAVRVTQEDGSRQDLLLSCLHVFSPAPDVNVRGRAGCRVLSRGQGRELARSTRQGGALYWNHDAVASPSFDAQLAQIRDRAAVQAALAGLVLSGSHPTVTSSEFSDLAYGRASGVPATFLILAPSSPQGLQVQFSHDHPPETPLQYVISFGDGQIRAWIHLEWAIGLRFLGAETVAGDSGSPVVYPRGDGSCTLLGMHAGVTDGGFAVMIPAWQLFNGDWYSPRLASIRPINP